MERLAPPKPLSLDGNLSQNWKTWKQNFTLYMEAIEYDEKTDKVKTSLLLHCIGTKAVEVYNTLTFDEEGDNKKYDKILEKFQAYFNPKKNITFARYKFFTHRQGEGQEFSKYHTELKTLMNDCELGAISDDLLKDMLVIGLSNKKMQERLLGETALTLNKVVITCQANEITRKQAKSMQKSSTDGSIDIVRKTGFDNSSKKDIINNCKFCSYSHKRGACPAYGKTCNICKKKNHFATRCIKRDKGDEKRGTYHHQKKVDQVAQSVNGEKPKNEEVAAKYVSSSTSESDDEFEHFVIDSIDTSKDDLISFEEGDDQWCVDLDTNGTVVNYKIDTGAQANILPWKQFCLLEQKPKLNRKQKVKLTAYNGTDIPVKGSCIIRIQQKRRSVPVLFIVADIDSLPILGLKTSSHLDLVRRVLNVNKQETVVLPEYLREYKDCFGEVGCMRETHHIVVNPDIPPVVHPPRRLPHAIHDKVYTEIQRMLKLGVIVPVQEPTDWVNSLVAVEKPDGTLRLCLDPRDLNKAIKRPHYVLPTTEEVIDKMTGAKCFTKIDASCAYWQIPIDYESSKLLTFNSPFGRFRYQRMAYGVNSASDICQNYISRIIENMEGVTNSQDDIIIWAEDADQLKERTIKVFDAIRHHGLKLNKKKCLFNKSEIDFLGHKITSDGVYPDNKKIIAITDMPYPENVKGLQRFLGSVNYLGKFIPNLSERTASIRKLLEKDAVWHLEKNHKDDIDTLKKLITESPLLKIYNPNLPTKVSSDASMNGLGAVLEQLHDDTWYPVAYASRSLTPAEQNYCQLEKETLSIVFACHRFHEYVYGRKFHVNNDHLPLKSIFKKSLIKAPPRIQRFLLRLQKYDFEMHYIKGELLKIPDTLSRASLEDTTPEIDEGEMKFFVHSVMSNYLISDKRMEQFQKETECDETLQILKQYITKGWPERRKDVPVAIRPYFNVKEELSIIDDVILKENRIVVPRKLRNEMRKLLHSGHLGIVKTKGRARETMYWPGMQSEIEDMINKCEACIEYQNKQKKESLQPHVIPPTPWTKVGTDLFEIKSKPYVIVVDYTTNFYDVSEIPDKQSETVAAHTKSIFSRYGIPKEVMSDNGPEYIGAAYKSFSKDWDFYHNTSSPKYPESNGQVERVIQLVKKTLKKAVKNDEDPLLALLATKVSSGPYDNTPPATLFFNRPIRTTIPSLNSSKSVQINKKLDRKMKNDSRRDLERLNVNDDVRLHDGKSWSAKGKIVEEINPRSFIVQTKRGSKLRRNRRDILIDRSQNDDTSDSDDALSLINIQEDVDNREADGEPQDIMDELINDDIEAEVLQPEVNEDNEDVQPAPMQTRSGRYVIPPRRLADYDRD